MLSNSYLLRKVSYSSRRDAMPYTRKDVMRCVFTINVLRLYALCVYDVVYP